MKIDTKSPLLNTDAQSLAEARNKEKVSAQNLEAAKAEEKAHGDVVKLSDRSRMIAKAQELAGQAPEVREAKIEDLRARINAGTYNVSGQSVAEAMIRKSITEV